MRTFRCTCYRDGKHALNSQEVAASMGEAVGVRYSSWSVDLVAFDFQVVAFVLQTSVVIGVSLSNSPMTCTSRLPKPDTQRFVFEEGMAAVLRPSTAYLIGQFARVSEGDIVCDTMAGVGTIPVECNTNTFVIGGELDGKRVEYAAGNVVRNGNRNIDCLQW